MLTKTLQKYLEAMEAPSAHDVAAALQKTVRPENEYRCLNPLCDEKCPWPTGYAAGRPTRFCSRRCRQIFGRVRARLVWELERIECALRDDGLLSKEREALMSAAGQTRWALQRYPEERGQ